MRRISILGLMGVIVAVTLGFAALREANTWWAGGVLLLTLGLFGYAILASVHGRKGWLGFLVACGGYLIAVQAMSEHELGWLPTTQAIAYVQLRVPGTMKFTTIYEPSVKAGSRILLTGSQMTVTADNISITGSGPPIASSRVPWAKLLPSAGNQEDFRSIGQDLFALLFGSLSALVSRRMFRPNPET